MTTAEKLAALTVLALDGSPLRLDSLWATQAAVLVWVRHFG